MGLGGGDNGDRTKSSKAIGTLSSQGRDAALGGFKDVGLTAATAGGVVGHLSKSVGTGVNAATRVGFGAVPGMIGDVINAEMGIDPTAAKISKWGGYALAGFNPALGYGVGMFGGLVADKAMDGLNARSHESFRDSVEAARPNTIKGYFDTRKAISIGVKNLDAGMGGWGDDPSTEYGNIDHHGGGKPTGVMAKNHGCFDGRTGGFGGGAGDGGGDGHGGTSSGGTGDGLGGSNQGGGDLLI